MKYRIIQEDAIFFVVQVKFLWWWIPLRDRDGDVVFVSSEKAEEYLKNRRKKQSPKPLNVIKEIEI